MTAMKSLLCLLALGSLPLLLGATSPLGGELWPSQVEAQPQDSSTCSCPAVSRCGKTAASCSVTCAPPKRAICECAGMDTPCGPDGPYGAFENRCACQ